MAASEPAWTEEQRRRWTRENAWLYVRPDAARFYKPGTDLSFLPKSPEQERLDRKSARLAQQAKAERAAADAEADWFRESEMRRLAAEIKYDILQLKWLLKYNPDQPRVPPGNPAGGQWATEGGGTTDLSAQRRRPPGGPFPGATPAQEARLAAAEARAQEALRRVRELDPNWQPSQSLTAPGSPEGQIARAQAWAQEADSRYNQLLREQGDRALAFGPPVFPGGASNEPLQNVLMPRGAPIGNPGTTDDIREVSPSEYRELRPRLFDGSQPTRPSPSYRGTYWRRGDGTTLGLRASDRYGLTVDVIDPGNSGLSRYFKVHIK